MRATAPTRLGTRGAHLPYEAASYTQGRVVSQAAAVPKPLTHEDSITRCRRGGCEDVCVKLEQSDDMPRPLAVSCFVSHLGVRFPVGPVAARSPLRPSVPLRSLGPLACCARCCSRWRGLWWARRCDGGRRRPHGPPMERMSQHTEQPSHWTEDESSRALGSGAPSRACGCFCAERVSCGRRRCSWRRGVPRPNESSGWVRRRS